MVSIGNCLSWSRAASAWCLAVIVLFLAQGAASRLLAQGAQDYIVTFREGANSAVRATAVRNAGAALRFNYGGVNAAAVRVPNANALAALQNHPSVLAIIPDRPVFASQRANGKNGKGGKGGNKGGGGGGSQQVTPAGVDRVGVPTAKSNGSGVGVAILDTGIDLAHPDLLGAIDAFNAFGGGSCQDDGAHGTHVAGIVAAQDNGADVIGVAPYAQLYCVKVLDDTGSGSDSTVMAGLTWVLDNHENQNIKVVNMSLGRPGSLGDNPPLRQLIASLYAAHVTVVVAAGNDPYVEVSQQIPAAYAVDETLIAVASTTALAGSNKCRFLGSPIPADTASYFTTDGPGATVVSAPGED